MHHTTVEFLNTRKPGKTLKFWSMTDCAYVEIPSCGSHFSLAKICLVQVADSVRHWVWTAVGVGLQALNRSRNDSAKKMGKESTVSSGLPVVVMLPGKLPLFQLIFFVNVMLRR
jgi:hypothetical protein